ncbi:hypothetical protein Esi_0170_0014 [Ectocarpus siliculosus]|uniref:Uncharacterized protein n=1 Tax=Ectocarpus siliculosus TaxID=2880 RepID=D7FMR8_ECTSI|nr:hypothetical protein Esi_0170_0014 [Ectocarpus siliculosus]|eukprot:CBJ29983.1 hypothetical protein Esi_0170_0014 [Ectocarpus siliculosus]
MLPLKSHIRGAMVSMMTRATASRRHHSPCETPAPGRLDAIGTGDGIGTFLGGTQLPMDPSTCIFWCAVALGALVKGNPLESVASYFRWARVSLDSYTGPANPEVAKAWTILGYLYGFMGDMAKFEEYLGFADSFLTASINEGSADTLPAGFAEIVHRKDTVKVCSDNLDPADMESFCARHRDAPRICEAVNDGELYRYVTQSFKVFQQVAYAKACAKSASRRRLSDDQCRAEGGEGVSAKDCGPLEDDVLDAMATGLRGYVIEFDQLEETANRPRIRAGVGGLIINGTLVFERAAKGDAEGTLERIRHCVEVFERYPGLCRCTMRWCHIAHAMLAALAAVNGSQARRLYDRLRVVYNVSRPPELRPVPALEDWQGIPSICDDFLCRCIWKNQADRGGFHQDRSLE